MRCSASAEEDNLSPFDTNIVCLCQSIENNNNKYKVKVKVKRFIGQPQGTGLTNYNTKQIQKKKKETERKMPCTDIYIRNKHDGQPGAISPNSYTCTLFIWNTRFFTYIIPSFYTREMIETILMFNTNELLDFHISYEHIYNRWQLPNQDISCLKE